MGYFRENVEKLAGYTPGFQPKGGGVVKLNTNENPYPPSPKVMEAVGSVGAEQLRRYPDPVGSSFRQAAAELNGVSADHIMCCNGGDDVLTIAIRSFCDAGRALAYAEPTYSLYPVLAQLQGCPVVEIPFDEEFNLPPKLAKTGAALTIVCNPNAPSGSFVEPAELGNLAEELDGVLLVDEAYADFAESNAAGLAATMDNVIVLRSMSKGYSLAGLRFGYVLGNPELIAGMMKVKDSYNVDAVAIAAATAAIKEQEYFRGNVAKVKKDRELLSAQLAALKLKVFKSHANFVLVQSKEKEASEIYDRLAERNIFVRYFKLPGLEDKLRITVGTSDQNDMLVLALKDILNKG